MPIFYLEIHCHFQSTSYMYSGGGDVIYFKKIPVFWKFPTWLLYLHHYIIPAHTLCLQPLPCLLLSLHLMTSLTTVICSHTCAESLQCCSCESLRMAMGLDSMSLEKPDSLSLGGCQLPSFVRFSPIHVAMPAGVTMQVLCRWPHEDFMYFSYKTKCKSHIKLFIVSVMLYGQHWNNL